jgi:hypothetical protein
VVPTYKVVRRRAKGAKAKEVEPNGHGEATHGHRPYLHRTALVEDRAGGVIKRVAVTWTVSNGRGKLGLGWHGGRSTA